MKRVTVNNYNVFVLSDCRDYLKNINTRYDYVFTVPPDFAEVGMDPIKDQAEYIAFLMEVFLLFKPVSGLVTISLTDRKFRSRIIAKHLFVVSIMQQIGYELISHKIWVKSKKQSLFRLNYSHILTFCNLKTWRQGLYPDYQSDVWEMSNTVSKAFRDNMNPAIVKRCLLNFTTNNQVVLDPFMGTASTAVAALAIGRRYIGCEIVEKVWQSGTDRLKERMDF